MSGIDPTIQPGTLEEKYEIMKARRVADGSWDEDAEIGLRRSLGMNDQQGEVTPEAASTDVPAVTKPRAKSRVKARK